MLVKSINIIDVVIPVSLLVRYRALLIFGLFTGNTYLRNLIDFCLKNAHKQHGTVGRVVMVGKVPTVPSFPVHQFSYR